MKPELLDRLSETLSYAGEVAVQLKRLDPDNTSTEPFARSLKPLLEAVKMELVSVWNEEKAA